MPYRNIILEGGQQIFIKDSVIDIDGTNLEDGISIYDSFGYVGYIVGVNAKDVNVERLEDFLGTN